MKLHSNGYILEVCLKYPDKLHESNNDSLLASEKLELVIILQQYCR